MQQPPETTGTTSLVCFQEAEKIYTKKIFKSIDQFLEYRGAQMPADALMELEADLHAANDAVEKFADEPTKMEIWLDHEYLRDTGRDIDKLIKFLKELFDDYKKLKIIQELIKETSN
jgi:hypothetical protein